MTLRPGWPGAIPCDRCCRNIPAAVLTAPPFTLKRAPGLDDKLRGHLGKEGLSLAHGA